MDHERIDRRDRLARPTGETDQVASSWEIMASSARWVLSSPAGTILKVLATKSCTSRAGACNRALPSGELSSMITTAVSYTHLRAHETDSYLVCRLLLE